MKNTMPVSALATTTTDEEGRYLAHELGKRVSLKYTEENLSDVDQAELAKVEIYIPFVNTRIGLDELKKMPRLRLIATRSTGYDHIDLEAAAQQGIAITNVPAYGERTVAEFAFALMLTLSRKVNLAATRTQHDDFSLEGLQGFDLYGKMLGVVGAGAIGLHMIRIAKGFGMDVVAFDVVQNRLIAEVLGFRYVDMDMLLSVADIVSLHVPALPSTYHMLNRPAFSKMKRGALLINTARGTLVDTDALVWALDNGLLGGAGLDVLEGEAYLQYEEELLYSEASREQQKLVALSKQLQHRDNVVITPHIGFNTKEALYRILDITVENIQAFLDNHPRNLVPLPQEKS
ncbi:D-lactate dehydrogenase [Thermosporothrix hazakensis]|uniref:D-lactate dehydrogenase n=2 Tax=Thermosporothrix TaxID=768650 RepID=A0A326U7A7_THEHA|nr:NAD(P)-dependent oxidoreductase [Thermosporothrix hazakensis]PZW29412.1 D-lactate dehydrogenase [Thermosporothrix hazakensis]BBH85699.1 lactate dehydrogenase [Thermosporothrix sp. COM3]GCE45872.1 lactate dehydrogenase [Thermosporothrix hazakensis]